MRFYRQSPRFIAAAALLAFALPGSHAFAQQQGSTASEAPSDTDRLSIPVTLEQAMQEEVDRERLNREQAAFAQRQLAENAASQAAHDRAVAEREAIIARQRAEQEAAEAAWQAEVQQRERAYQDYEDAMARWRAQVADVEACNAGDRSRCPPLP